MLKSEYKIFVENAKSNYKKIGCIECPAFIGEKIYFNHYGLQHILFKGRYPRTPDQVKRRFDLTLKYFKTLKNIKRVDSEEKSIVNGSTVYFWAIGVKVRNATIRIIIRRLNNGTLHFFSIMDEGYHYNKTQSLQKEACVMLAISYIADRALVIRLLARKNYIQILSYLDPQSTTYHPFTSNAFSAACCSASCLERPEPSAT